MVEEAYTHIVWTPCAAHCMDLMMEDIGRLDWIAAVMWDAVQISHFFRRRWTALSIFREYSRLDITRPSRTRFAYMFVVLERLLEVHAELRRTVVSEEWKAWDESSDPEAQYVQRQCLDADFWSTMQSIVTTLRPIYIMLRMTDMEGCTMGLLYHFMQRIRKDLAAHAACDEAVYNVLFSCAINYTILFTANFVLTLLGL